MYDYISECHLGYLATVNNTCLPCTGNTYGKMCVNSCQCSNMQL